MKDWVLNNVVTIITTIFGGGSLYGYLTERKKRKVEEGILESSFIEQMQKTYRTFEEDMTKKYLELTCTVADLKTEINSLNSQLDIEITKNKQLQRDYSSLKDTYNTLKEEVDKYKNKKK